MNLKSLIDRSLNNWPAKLICFAIALMLFLFHQMSSLGRRYYSIPLNVYAEGTLTPAGTYPRVVRISIRGEPNQISAIQENDFTAFVDMSYFTDPGTYRIPVQIQLGGTALAADPLEVSVEPQEISFALDKKGNSFVPVTPSFSGEPAKGFQVTGYSVNPAMVEIAGPQSMVDTVREILSDSVSIAGRSAGFTASAALLNQNTMVSAENVSSVTVTVQIAPIQSSRVFANLPVLYDGLSENLVVSGPSRVITAELSGPINQLETFTFADRSVIADCSAITEPG
ncbi:MAG: hypothetical protein LBU99_02135, partial [Spirochaetaceae bacterium]|nr:hypothetical protein [Spirochaetaceae bacterium]